MFIGPSRLHLVLIGIIISALPLLRLDFNMLVREEELAGYNFGCKQTYSNLS